MLKKRVPVVLFAVVLFAIVTMAPAVADDGPVAHVTVTMPDGTVTVLDSIFDITITHTDLIHDLQLKLGATGQTGVFKVVISGTPGFLLDVQTPADDGGICNPGGPIPCE